VICEVKSGEFAECIDRQPTGAREAPAPDTEGETDLVAAVSVAGEWTTVTFEKPTVPWDDQDYNLAQVRPTRQEQCTTAVEVDQVIFRANNRNLLLDRLSRRQPGDWRWAFAPVRLTRRALRWHAHKNGRPAHPAGDIG